ncbi:MAG: hypothetical protein MR270_00470 [Erysipelotrichaceae bacterium]|nr:hypothetical protein [Erysipelotrichaceae bacterium]
MNIIKFSKRFKNYISKHKFSTLIILFFLSILLYVANYYFTNWLNTTSLSQISIDVITKLSSYTTSVFSISATLAQIIYLIKSLINKYKKSINEEETKTESNHHKIIRSYVAMSKDKNSFDNVGKSSHPVININTNDNYFSHAEGDLMQLHHIVNKNANKIKPESKSQYTKDYEKERLAIEIFQKGYNNGGFVNIANVNMYTNLKQNTLLHIKDDIVDTFKVDDFIGNNRQKLLGAHSAGKNNKTIRLNDFSFDNDHILSLTTQRTTYFDMLITNRAMDYDIDGVTLRKMYEYKSKLTPLNKSKFANHIGITGVILSSDNYVLLEKRDLSKSTWRDKFGPTISLALKADDIIEEGKSLKDPSFDLNNKIVERIKKSLKENYSFIENEDYDSFTFSSSFLGLARDLLEGGKPNMYFCIKLKKNAKDAALDMQKYASLGEVIKNSNKPYNFKKDIIKPHELAYNEAYEKDNENKRVPLKDDKLTGDYYFIPFEQIKLDYYYQLYLPKGTIKVQRRFKPRFKKGKNPTKLYTSKKAIVKECGEGLLATLSYLEIFQDNYMKKVGVADE